MTQDNAVAAQAHDALWAVLWHRRYDDVDEPLWLPDSAFSGILAFARTLDGEASVAGVDTGRAFVVVRTTAGAPPIGSRVRMLPAMREQWRFAEVHPLGLGADLRFDDQSDSADTSWVATLRAGIVRLRELLDARRERLSARRAQLGALSEPPALEEIWRDELAILSDRIALETEYTPAEHAALSRARAKGARSADEEERKIVAARKRRFAERGNDAIARFREEQWPAIRDKAIVETRKYADYRTEVVRLEDALQRIRALAEGATRAVTMLDALETSGFRVNGLTLDAARLGEVAYAEELLRSVELLHAAIPLRAQKVATSFSAYRAPTAGPSVIPPRL